MDLQWLAPAFEAEGPLASVTLDISRSDASGEHEVELRWREVRRSLEEQGAPEQVLDLLADRATAPSGRADTGDGSGRTVVAGTGGVVLDLVLPKAPAQDEGTWGSLPQVLPAVRAAAGATRYVLVATDRAGADLTVAVGAGVTTARPEGGDAVVGASSDVEETRTSGSDDDVLHKVPVGGVGEHTHERRVEDSWERDAAAVAKDVDDLVGRYKPHVVVLTGDDTAVSLVRERLGGAASAIAEVVQGGGRADGIRSDDFAQTLGELLARVQEGRLKETTDSFEQARGQDADGTDGIDAVVTMLQRGQVQDVLLRDDPSSTWTLWVGPDPLQLASSREDLLEMGVSDPVEVRADAALLRAAVGGAAGLVLVPGARQDETDELELADGVGALLRWSDEGTPGGSAPTMSGDADRLRDVGA
ncbi:Vms1/Ankzf1 family peptidyl-tRNA hydrolase [Pseudokineococcus basanitobsidens]|uniref:Vms1/Ankzf1 family peptidyl-tRNA hydrolase n=1 Tax=Pseudokineococcus basanitobsidens TaxID=1926649 RepID=A0ABU8RMI0_9ACTN